MNSLQKVLLWFAGGLGALLVLVVTVNLTEVDPNGAMTVLAGLITGCVGAAVAANRKGKD